MIYPIDRQDIPAYADRCSKRQDKLITATMNFVQYFMDLGDDKITAEIKVSQVSTETAAYLYAYVLGNKIPLLDTINASTLEFMDTAAKEYLIEQLS
jgi:hypothetical protein